MVFSSYEFLAFIAIVFVLYYVTLQHKKLNNVVLLLANAIFYVWAGVKGLLIIACVILLSFLGIRLLKNATTTASLTKRRVLFATTLVVTLVPLLLSKYTSGFPAVLGISFFTFQAVSCVCDTYLGRLSEDFNLCEYAVYVSFFPSISSGPIERMGNFLPQLRQKREFDYDCAVYGLRLFLIGMLKKMVISDSLGKYVDMVFDNVSAYSGPAFCIAIFMFTFQIYCDFSGYSDMALGVAKLMGIELTQNFKMPYMAASVKEFWGRWHISLSNWLRDYVYIPLGGNRKGRFRKCLNLMITFLVSGVWHGADVSFVVWGGLHGVYQIAEELLPKRKNPSKAFHIIRVVITFILVSFAWMFFRANTITDAIYILRRMFIPGDIAAALTSMEMGAFSVVKVLASIAFVLLWDYANSRTDLLAKMGKLPMLLRWGIYAVVFVFVITLSVHNGVQSAFIYARF